MHEYPGFLFVNSDLFNHTPNLQVDILRDQAKLYGVSETRILTLLHDAYSQNYSYLIKKTTDQYQVILEVADNERSDPQDLSKLYIKSDDGQRMVPLNAVTSSHAIIGPQAVNHINQFTSVTLFFNMKPGYTVGQATDFVEKSSRKQSFRPMSAAIFRAQALTFRNTASDLVLLMLVAVFVMYVILAILYESYLHPDHRSFFAARSSGRWIAYPVAIQGGSFAVRLYWDVHADGHREEERHHDRGFCRTACSSRNQGRSSDSRRQHGTFSADHDDHDGCSAGRAAHCAWFWG